MDGSEPETEPAAGIGWPAPVGALVALVGLADSVYLTGKHFQGSTVPCSLVSGCEKVLTSSYSEIAGIPLAAFGALAYFTAFSLAVLTAFGRPALWRFFGIQSFLMAAFSAWLVYLQAFVIGAFCQFCLVSAASSLSLFAIFLVSVFSAARRRDS